MCSFQESFSRAGNYALYGMFIKQGISCGEDVGKGEINSAFDGLQALTGIVMPLFWSRAYAFFQGKGMPGGAFIVAAVLNLLSHLCVVLAPPKQSLYVRMLTSIRSPLSGSQPAIRRNHTSYMYPPVSCESWGRL